MNIRKGSMKNKKHEWIQIGASKLMKQKKGNNIYKTENLTDFLLLTPSSR